jgi:hypothetical protein
VGIERATGIVWNITGGSDLTLFEVNQAAEIIYDLVDPEVREYLNKALLCVPASTPVELPTVWYIRKRKGT